MLHDIVTVTVMTVICDITLFLLLLSSKVRKEIIKNKNNFNKQGETKKKQVHCL